MIAMIMFAFHAVGDGTSFHRDLARSSPRYVCIAGVTLEQAFAPARIMREHLGQMRAFILAGKTLRLPVAKQLFG